MATKITVDIEFIKLARSYVDAQKDAALSPTPRAKRRSEQLDALFRAKLSVYEKQVAGMEEKSVEEMPAKLL